ncbi:hypothetical protein EWM64_g608 [Hericium alpestre]|uniref:AMP-dependent synthetase/ligase domain-containing protein n=1 Tax=Hericium alpestre TaxID=135208 RepID=A0A4Z0AAM7_9AGAM|nr:hypothetical protein EWM64_g608 [Hericium alpestre]
MTAAAQAAFRPTQESIPPSNAELTLRIPDGVHINLHPLIYPNKLALAHADVPHPVFYTYAVWAQRVQNLAYALIHAGIEPGDRIAVIAPNSPMIADALQAVCAARCILTTINIRLTKQEVDYILEHSGAKILFVDHEYVHLAKGAKAKVIVCRDTGLPSDPYEQFLSSGRHLSRERGWGGLVMDADENKPCSLNYTSGTTGRPKGVLTTLRGTYLAAVANAYETQMDRYSSYLWVLPMFHAAGWTYPWACTFAFATQVTIRTVDAGLIWKHLLHSRVTHYCGAPTVEIAIVNHPDARSLGHPVTAIIAGAAPTAHLISELEKKGIKPVHVYGLTETYGPITRGYPQDSWANLPPEERNKLAARQGHAFATSHPTRVVYPPGDHPSHASPDILVDVPKDGKTIGEIAMAGNIVTSGYYKDPEATKRAFRGGWFSSGDLAVWYPDGSIAIQDRSKDIIISGGENASSLAIEQELATYPDILEVSVVAREHPKWGERPMAFVQLRPEAVKKWAGRHKEFAASLQEHVKERLPGFARPEWVTIVDELPKTSTGKILKTSLRRMAKEMAKL